MGIYNFQNGWRFYFRAIREVFAGANEPEQTHQFWNWKDLLHVIWSVQEQRIVVGLQSYFLFAVARYLRFWPCFNNGHSRRSFAMMNENFKKCNEK